MTDIVYSACVCCYTAFNFSDIKVLCVSEGEFLCCVQKGCLAAGEEQIKVGLITDKDKGEICKLGLPCCFLGLKKPTVLAKGKAHVLCCVQAASFPFDGEFVPAPICAVCFLQCAPNVGCAKPSKKEGGAPAETVDDANVAPAVDAEAMVRL